MDPIFTHIVTETELAAHPEAFPEGTLAGSAVELSEENYTILGLKLYILTEDDLISNAKYTNLGLTVGDKVEVPLKASSGSDTE